jgi:inner membrane protein
MDNLTHGLLGLAIGALRRPEGDPGRGRRLSPTDRAVLLSTVLAAELPDLDGLWPAQNVVLDALEVHRGISHSLLFSPLWAGLATAVAVAVFRGARPLPAFLFGWAAVVFAHLAADAWTGWGTRMFLPFSEARVSWDWMVVVDPIFTAPLLAGALVAVCWRSRWRQALVLGLLLAGGYLLARVGVKHQLEGEVAARHPTATQITVFPDWFGILRWRYVAEAPEGYVAGTIRVGERPVVWATHPRPPPLPDALGAVPTIAQAVSWARFPLTAWAEGPDEGATVRIADLRYHLYGEPTLSMSVEVDGKGEVTLARLDRPPRARELLEQWRTAPDRPSAQPR